MGSTDPSGIITDGQPQDYPLAAGRSARSFGTVRYASVYAIVAIVAQIS